MQHPFVSSKSVDKKPILDLLAEFKAEIINEVEEEIEDEVRTGYNEVWAMGNKKKSKFLEISCFEMVIFFWEGRRLHEG